jgi:hypothetical protein
MSYLVVAKNRTKKLKDLRKEDWDMAQKGEVTLINLNTLTFYDHSTNDWIYILTLENSGKDKPAKKSLDRHDFLKIRTIAHDIFLQKGVDKESQEYMRDYLLFSALERYLIGNKIEPGFSVKK